jgi:hypothetical protein
LNVIRLLKRKIEIDNLVEENFKLNGKLKMKTTNLQNKQTTLFKQAKMIINYIMFYKSINFLKTYVLYSPPRPLSETVP